jgi:hypothetical protein
MNKAFCGAPNGGLPHLGTFREGGVFMYVFANQQFGQWLTKATDNHGLGFGGGGGGGAKKKVMEKYKICI